MIPISSAKVKTFEPEKAQPKVEYVENFIVVWLDQSTNQIHDDQTSIKQLKQVANSVNVFIDPGQCQEFISGIKDVKILVILSGKVEEQFVSNVHEEKQLESMYVFSPGKKKEETWFNQYPEIRGVYTSIIALCEQLSKDIRIIDYNLLGFEVMKQSTSSTNQTSKGSQQEAQFMYDQLFRDIVLTTSDEDMQDMFQYCEKKYRQNLEVQNLLETLKRTYGSRSPIWWYSQDSFLYRMTNKALRNHDYDTLYLLRVFIRHLHEKLVALQKENIMDRIDLFRGQAMEKDEFEQLRQNEGGLLSISSFLSTSLDREMGLRFARNSLKDHRKVSILMEIKVEKSTMVPAANIEKLSFYQTEKEWLFSMGAVFRIGKLKCSDEGIWIVPLTLTDDKDEQLNDLREHLKKSMTDKDSCLNFGSLMYKLASWEKAEYFYLKALENASTPQRLSFLYNSMGMIKDELKEYERALDYYHKSLALKESEGPDSIASRAPTYNNIATLYYSQKKMDRAMEYYQKAIDASNTQENQNEGLVATLNGNMASILSDKGKYEEALQKAEEALRIRIKVCPAIDPDIASAYATIANIQYSMGSYAEAVVNMEKALKIDRQALPKNHPQRVTHEKNLEVFKQQQKSA